MTEQWYYRLQGEEFGPVSAPALRDLLGGGTISASDEVRRNDDSHWQPAGELQWDVATGVADNPTEEIADPSDLDSLLAGPSSTSAAEGSGRTDAAASDLDAMLAPSRPGRRKPLTDDWYYRVSGQRFGPFDFDTLFDHAASRQFSRYDEVLSPGSDDWVEAQMIVGLFPDEEMDLDTLLVDEQPLPASVAPAPAPVRKQWYYRVLNQELGPVDFEGLFDLVMEGNLRPDDDLRERDQTEWQRADSLVGLFPNEDDHSDRADAPVAVDDEPDAPQNEDDACYIRMDGQELGPVTFERLVQLAQAGRLQRTDPIRLSKLGPWMDAESMVGLFPDEKPAAPDPPAGTEPAVAQSSAGDNSGRAATPPSKSNDRPQPPLRTSGARPAAAEPAPPRTGPASVPPAVPKSAAPSSPGGGIAAAGSTPASQRPAFTPPPKSSRRKTSSGGGFSLPSGLGDSLTNPKVLGAAAAVLLVVGLVFVPWGGLISPRVDDLVAELEAVWEQVKPLYENEAPDAEWTRVTGSVQPKLAEIAQEATDRGAGKDYPALHIVYVLAGEAIPKVLDDKMEARSTQIKGVDSFLARIKEM